MTVGLVLVSHSATLAGGAAELADQLTSGAVVCIPAGGTDDGGLGTSVPLIAEAVGRADSGDGVVLLADLGSSVLSVQVMLEELIEADGNGAASRLRFADAPFVEGTVAAAVAASTGADLATVHAAAVDAWAYRKS